MTGQAEIFDTHCHLGHGDMDAAALLARAREAGVSHVLDVGIDLESSTAARQRAHELQGVRFAAGLHPTEAGRLDDEWHGIAELAEDPACVAIGESGFDFYWDRSTPEQQRRSFERHLDLARRLGKPIVVHCRDAFDATFEVLAEHADQPFVLHCFSGGVPEARRALELGGMLSFAGPLTYPRAEALREAAAFAPADRLLVETDAPFLAPQAQRGKPNEPAYVAFTLERLAELRGCGRDEMATQTTANARQLFGL